METPKNGRETTYLETLEALEVDQFYSDYPLQPQQSGPLESVLVEGQNSNQLFFVFANRQMMFDPDKGWISTSEIGSSDSGGALTETFRHGSHAYMIMMMSSNDGGRSWQKPWPILDQNNQPIPGFHITVLLLPSGRLGMVYSGYEIPGSHPGRNYGTTAAFRISKDEGRTWTEATPIDSHWSLCPSGHTIVLSSGRILAPAFRWISPIHSNDAEGWPEGWDDYEGAGATLSYSYSYFSDDEGKSWDISLSELFVSSSRAAYDLEEPTAVELRNGDVLMHMRSQLGRIYRSLSTDQGLTWSTPEPLDIASSYCPQYLTRMPTGDLLMIWNQSSRQEIMLGLNRHRLSCAVSQDEGNTWGYFKNLESLDHITKISPPPKRWVQVVEQFERYRYHQPTDSQRYVRAPGILRVCYPNVRFRKNEAIIIYDVGYGILGNHTGTKLRAVPIDWFTE